MEKQRMKTPDSSCEERERQKRRMTERGRMRERTSVI